LEKQLRLKPKLTYPAAESKSIERFSKVRPAC